MRRQDVQRLPQSVDILLVVGDDDGMDDGVVELVSVRVELEVNVAGFAAGGGAGM